MIDQERLMGAILPTLSKLHRPTQGLAMSSPAKGLSFAGEPITDLLWPEQMQGVAPDRMRVVRTHGWTPISIQEPDAPQGFALFRKRGNEVVINEHGAFVPIQRGLFEQGEEVSYKVSKTLEGRPAVILSSRRRDTPVADNRVDGPRGRRVEQIDASRELRWLAEHGREYAGQWVALDGDRLLVHGESAREVYKTVRTLNVRLPLVGLVAPMGQ